MAYLSALSPLVLTVLVTTITAVSINPPIPVLAPAPGILLGNGTRSSMVVVEAFLEMVCPDSAKAWPELNKLVEHYPAGNVAVIVHQVPLPYHRNSMISTQGIHAIQKLMPTKVHDYIEAIFDNLLMLSNTLTTNLDDNEVLEVVTEIAVTATGVDKTAFKAEITNHRSYAIYAWKYATRRGVAGTPWYFVNGVDIGANPSTLITKSTWVEYIDGLLG